MLTFPKPMETRDAMCKDIRIRVDLFSEAKIEFKKRIQSFCVVFFFFLGGDFPATFLGGLSLPSMMTWTEEKEGQV